MHALQRIRGRELFRPDTAHRQHPPEPDFHIGQGHKPWTLSIGRADRDATAVLTFLHSWLVTSTAASVGPYRLCSVAVAMFVEQINLALHQRFAAAEYTAQRSELLETRFSAEVIEH